MTSKAKGWGAPVAAGGLGVVAGALVCLGAAALPWVSSFAGLLSLGGTATWRGDLVLALGALLVAAALALVATRRSVLRLAVGGLGFVTVVLAGYLLLNLAAEVGGADSMALVTVGAGLPVVLGGGALALATLFLPGADTSVRVAGAPDLAEAADASPGAQSRSAGTTLRWLAGVAAVTAAVAHVPVTPEHLQEAPYIGVGFIALTVALIGLTTALVVSPSRTVWLLLALVCVGAVAAYVVSRTVGLPLIADDIGNWFEPLGVVSVLSESVAALAAVVALRTHRTHASDASGGEARTGAPHVPVCR